MNLATRLAKLEAMAAKSTQAESSGCQVWLPSDGQETTPLPPVEVQVKENRHTIIVPRHEWTKYVPESGPLEEGETQVRILAWQ